MGKDVKRKLNISEVEHELFIIGCRAMKKSIEGMSGKFRLKKNYLQLS